MGLTRRAAIVGLAVLPAAPRLAAANQSRELEWEDLIPEGVPYGEIVGDGLYDEQADIWIPEFDANAGITTSEFDGMTVRIPGYIVPLDYDAAGAITGFLLAPFAGACIHVPPPRPTSSST